MVVNFKSVLSKLLHKASKQLVYVTIIWDIIDSDGSGLVLKVVSIALGLGKVGFWLKRILELVNST